MTVTQERKEEPMTFEQLREMFREIGRKQEETARQMEETDRRMEETDRQLKETDQLIKENAESIKETWRQMKETDRQMKETDRQMKETDKRVGFLSNRFGEVVEYMIVPNLVAKFNELGYAFQNAYRDEVIRDPEHDIFTEVDVTLRNGDCVMIVETKTKPNTDDVDNHSKRMEKLRAWADLHKDKRKYYGAIAGVVMSDRVKTYTLEQGFYAIEPSGETFTITEPTGNFTPKVW
jgi:predicted RNase H-like nuclease (RuvC/YqgF family)